MDEIDGDELVAERGRPAHYWLERMGLFLYGEAKGPIWAMEERPGVIGLRLDCGDSGRVCLTKEQAKEVIDVLQHFL
jgi:hypothetical protein